jgi:hypothetical protein
MSTPHGHNLDPQILALKGALFDTLPPPKPLKGRAVDHDVLSLDSGLFDTLPPPPPMGMLRDSLAPIVEAEMRGDLPAVEVPVRRFGAAGVIGLAAAVGLMAAGLAVRHEAPAAAAPRPIPTITLPEVLIVADIPRPELPAVIEAPAPKQAVTGVRGKVAAAAPAPAPVAAPAPAPDDLAVAMAVAVPPPQRELDASDAARAVSNAARSAKSCLDEGETRTTMSVSVTFAPSGNVTTAKITGGPFLGTATGSCIARALRSAWVRPFAGDAVVVNTTVRVR